MENSVAIILAGGYGTRLWPISTERNPKQFCQIYGEGTLLNNTYQRLLKFFRKENIYIVTQTFYFDKILKNLPNFELSNLILEPYVRQTAAAITYAFFTLIKRYPSTTNCFVFPSDHFISNEYEFANSLEIAENASQELQGIITLGIRPTRAESQYGYIQLDEGRFMQTHLYNQGVRWVRTFAEKPDLKTAQRFINAGDFVWNSGIFVFTFDTFEKELIQHLPNYHNVFKKLNLSSNNPNFADELDFAYRSIMPVSFDNGILEKSRNIFCVISNFEWSDIGSWDEIYRLSMKDASGNYINGEVITFNTHNSLIIGRDRLVSTYDIENLIIIETENATFITHLGSSLGVKKITDYLNSQGIKDYL